jgi:hypothetical protein
MSHLNSSPRVVNRSDAKLSSVGTSDRFDTNWDIGFNRRLQALSTCILTPIVMMIIIDKTAFPMSTSYIDFRLPVVNHIFWSRNIFLQSKFASLASGPQRGGSGSFIHVPDYKPEGRGFDSRCHWTFFFIYIFHPAAVWLGGWLSPLLSTRNLPGGGGGGATRV